MSDKLLVQLEHPITGEYVYPKVLESGIILSDGRTLEGYIKDVSVFIMPKPSTVEVNTKTLQTYLNYAKTFKKNVEIVFREGVYNLNTCVIYANTTLVLQKNTTINHIRVNYYNPNLDREAIMNPLFLNAKPFDLEDSNITGYNGNGNIKIEANGGVIKAYNPFAFIHGKNIKFNNIVFKETKSEHVIQMASCKNVEFNKCEFIGIVDVASSRKYVEMVQLDWTTYTAMPYWIEGKPIYDNEVNDNIIFNDCRFSKGESEYSYVHTCIGSHGSTTVKNKNIYINRCYFNDFNYNAIKLYWMENVYINSCNFNTNSTTPSIGMTNCNNVNIDKSKVCGGSRFIFANTSENISVNRATIESLNGSDSFILFAESKDITIEDISIKNSVSSNYALAIRNSTDVIIDKIKDIDNDIKGGIFVILYTKDSGISDKIIIKNLSTNCSKLVRTLDTTNLIDGITKEVLFEGEASSGEITLNDSIENFKNVRICISYYGNIDTYLSFYNNICDIKHFNMADDLSKSLDMDFLELRIEKINNTTLKINHLNQVKLSNGTVTTTTPTAKIVRIYGERIKFK